MIVTNAISSVTSSSAVVLPAHRLVNLSSRGLVGTGVNALAAGFVSSGTGTKQYLVRAIGPTLSGFGVTNVLAQPVLTVYSGSTVIATNTGWANSATVASVSLSVGAFALPATSADSVLVATLAPGSYTAQVTGVGGTTGNALVEIYEVGADLTELLNVSTRAPVGGNGQNLTAGLVVSGTGPIQVLLRGIGPALSTFGVSTPLAHPLLTLYSGSTVLATNSGWSTGSVSAATISGAETAVGAFALAPGSADAVLLMTLAPGSYTVQVSSLDGTTGVALVEAYQVM